MDATNSGIPAAGGQLSGDVTRMAAIKRLQRMQTPKAEGHIARPLQSSGPNTGPTGLPKPGAGLMQTPGQAPPGKPRRGI